MRFIRTTVASVALATTFSAVTLSTGAGASAAPSLATCRSTVSSLEYAKGDLTAATDNPVYTPWFVNNKPSNGQGYEAAVVYAVAKELGIAASHVKWAYEPFDSSYTPGTKNFDFDINEISVTPARAKAVTFSVSYYDVNQSIVALKSDAIVKKHSASQLKNYTYGDQIGTTGLAYINNQIKPKHPARVYSTLDEAVAALQEGQIDALIIDTPTGQYMASSQIQNAKKQYVAAQVAQFPSVGEHYGLLFQKGSKLAACVNVALGALTSSGQLAKLQTKWLGLYTSVPTIKP